MEKLPAQVDPILLKNIIGFLLTPEPQTSNFSFEVAKYYYLQGYSTTKNLEGDSRLRPEFSPIKHAVEHALGLAPYGIMFVTNAYLSNFPKVYIENQRKLYRDKAELLYRFTHTHLMRKLVQEIKPGEEIIYPEIAQTFQKGLEVMNDMTLD